MEKSTVGAGSGTPTMSHYRIRKRADSIIRTFNESASSISSECLADRRLLEVINPAFAFIVPRIAKLELLEIRHGSRMPYCCSPDGNGFLRQKAQESEAWSASFPTSKTGCNKCGDGVDKHQPRADPSCRFSRWRFARSRQGSACDHRACGK